MKFWVLRTKSIFSGGCLGPKGKWTTDREQYITERLAQTWSRQRSPSRIIWRMPAPVREEHSSIDESADDIEFQRKYLASCKL